MSGSFVVKAGDCPLNKLVQLLWQTLGGAGKNTWQQEQIITKLEESPNSF